MTSLRVREIHASLVRKGFRCEVGTNHQKYHFVCEGKDTGVVTLLSRSFDEYSDSLLTRLAKQVRLSRSEFMDLVSCALGPDAYLQLLKERGAL